MAPICIMPHETFKNFNVGILPMLVLFLASIVIQLVLYILIKNNY